MSVCVIGGGFAAVIGARVCQSNNLQVTLINKQPSPGGIWTGSPNEVGIWNSLKTNDSKYIMSFSDFEWNSSDSDFPTAGQVLSYLNSYIDHHNLREKFINSCKVTSVSKISEKFLVKWEDSQKNQFEQIFDYVLIATGRFARPINPFKNTSEFKGEILHGAYYREPSSFKNKKVVTIGKSFTGSDIGAELVETAESVTQIYRKPYFCIPRYIQQLPYDFWFYHLSMHDAGVQYLNSPYQCGQFGKMVLDLAGNPSQYHPEWEIDPSTIYTDFYGFTSHTDLYFESVKQRKINCVKGEAKELYSNGVVLTDGRVIEADSIILGTGYTSNYDFLSDELKNILQYNENDGLMTTCMYRSIFHPDIKGLAFVGAYATDCPGRFELQAEIGVRYILNTLELTEEDMRKGVKEEEHIRQNLRTYPWPYDFYGYMRDCFRILKMEFDFQFINEELKFANGPMIPFFFFLERPGQKERAQRAVEEIIRLYPHYDFSLVQKIL
jgi:dimethylaniline monooxygenase (N-oxide forming)